MSSRAALTAPELHAVTHILTNFGLLRDDVDIPEFDPPDDFTIRPRSLPSANDVEGLPFAHPNLDLAHQGHVPNVKDSIEKGGARKISTHGSASKKSKKPRVESPQHVDSMPQDAKSKTNRMVIKVDRAEVELDGHTYLTSKWISDTDIDRSQFGFPAAARKKLKEQLGIELTSGESYNYLDKDGKCYKSTYKCWKCGETLYSSAFREFYKNNDIIHNDIIHIYVVKEPDHDESRNDESHIGNDESLNEPHNDKSHNEPRNDESHIGNGDKSHNEPRNEKSHIGNDESHNDPRNNESHIGNDKSHKGNDKTKKKKKPTFCLLKGIPKE